MKIKDNPNARKPWHNSRMVVWWWYRPDGARLPMYNSVGIYRMLKRYDYNKRDTVILQCLVPNAWEFIQTLDGTMLLEVRYAESEGRVDNPLYGRPLYYLRDLRRRESWINRIAPVEYSAEPVSVFLHADCFIEEVVQWQRKG